MVGILGQFIRDRIFKGRYGTEKPADDLLIAKWVCDIAQTVAGTGESDYLNTGSTVCRNFQTHGAGHHTVLFTVKQKNRNLAMADCLFGGTAAKGESAEQSGTQICKGTADRHRIM